MEEREKAQEEEKDESKAVAKVEKMDVTQVRDIDPIQAVKEQIQTVQRLYRQIMKPGHHYGIIPGTKKPTLLQPGAELLTSTFRLAPKFEVEKEWLSGGHLNFDLKCNLFSIKTGDFVGQGVGSCSTMESKYRYRWTPAGNVPKEYWQNRNSPQFKNLKTRQDKNGNWFFLKRTENDQIADTYNTVKKMGMKRSLVSATRTVTGVSDVFEQDDEDFNHNGWSKGDYAPGQLKDQPASSSKARGKPRGVIAKEPKHLERVAEIVKMAADKNIDAQTLLLCLGDTKVKIPKYVTGFENFRYLFDEELDTLDAYINGGEIKTSEPLPESSGPAPTKGDLKVESHEFDDSDVTQAGTKK